MDDGMDRPHDGMDRPKPQQLRKLWQQIGKSQDGNFSESAEVFASPGEGFAPIHQGERSDPEIYQDLGRGELGGQHGIQSNEPQIPLQNATTTVTFWSNKCTCAENSRKFKKIGFFVHFSLFYKVKIFRK